MSNKPWKQFEREVAALFGGRRFWSNSGEEIDVESATVVAQCKHVKTLSLNALTDLAEVAAQQGTRRFKAGVVAVKVRRRQGAKRTPLLVVMTEETWRALHGDPSERREHGPAVRRPHPEPDGRER